MRTGSLFAGASVVVVSLVCGHACKPEPITPRAGKAVLDAPVAAGQVRCGPVTKASELIGGPGAYGVVGHAYVCNNAKIRFLIQDAQAPRATSARGGNLIDVDLARTDPNDASKFAPGEDTFREHVSAIGAKEAAVDTIEVANDGLDGKAGIIRVSGPADRLTLAPQAYYLEQPIEGRLTTDYVLKPDATYVEVITKFENAGEPIANVTPADFLAFGGATTSHTFEAGFGDAPLFAPATSLDAARGAHVSYAWLCEGDEDLLIPFTDQGSTAPFCGSGVPVGKVRSFVRWLVVGDGSLESTTRQVLALRSKRHGSAHGVVRDLAGAPAGGVLVSALNHSLAPNDDARVRNEARTAGDGTFALTLAPGDYVLVAHAPARARGPEVAVTIADGADVEVGPLTVGGTGRVEGTTSFVDADGSAHGAVPAKLTLVPTGDTQRPSESLAQFRAGSTAAYQVTKDGAFALDVVPGTYRAYVSRGFEWERAEADIVVTDGATTRVDLTIARAFDAPGAVNAEMHQHSLGSIDANVPVATKIMENAAEGIEIGVSTDHDNVTDFRPHIEALGLTPFIRAFAGNEVSYQSIGHFNVYPWAVDDADPAKDAGARLWWGKTVPRMFADVRALAAPETSDAIVQINHPRAALTGYFAALLVNPVDASRIPRDPPVLPSLPDDIYTAWAGNFDAVEVNGNLGDASLFTAEGAIVLAERAHNGATDVPTLADYFGLLGAGMSVVAVGNSDSHHVDEGVGYPRNFVFAGDDPLVVDEAAFKSAIRAQRVAVGEGCLLTLTADNALRMGRGELVAPGAQIAVQVRAPSFVSVGALEVYVNGRVQRLVGDATGVNVEDGGAISLALADPAAPRPVERVEAAITGLTLTEDAVVFALARNGGGLDPTGAGGVFCYSAPLYVDVDGDGEWTPWLADSQQVAP